jgi:hypothetical protein
MTIPLQIHQVFGLKGDVLPDSWSSWMDEWSTLNPEFEHRVWSSIDCNRLVWDKDREFWNTWKLIPNEASIDYRDHYATASKTREILNAYPAYSNIRRHKVDVTTDLASIFEHNYYDAIYIDGAHDYSSVSRDIRAVVPLLHKDGILLGDDFDSQSVAKAVGYQLGRSVRTAGSQWWISASHIRLRAPLTGGRFLLYIPVQLATRSLANDDGGMTIFCDAQTKGFSLNNSARSIYELCDGNRNVRNIIEILSEAYEIQESIIEQQVIESLQQLRACHMVDYA